MNEFDYGPNSHKSKEEAKNLPVKKVEKVVTGKVRTKKKSEFQKLVGMFVSEDIPNLKEYVIMDVLIPTIKNAIEDVVTNGIRMILRGETSARNTKKSTASKVSYRDYYDDKRDDDRNRSNSNSRSSFSYDEIIFDSRGEAEEALTRMDELLDTYGKVSVADLYDLADLTWEYTYSSYGWTNLGSARVVRERDGYSIKLPRPIPIK